MVDDEQSDFLQRTSRFFGVGGGHLPRDCRAVFQHRSVLDGRSRVTVRSRSVDKAVKTHPVHRPIFERETMNENSGVDDDGRRRNENGYVMVEIGEVTW